MNLSKGYMKSHIEGNHRISKAKAKIPTAFGAAADVPPCVEVHLSRMSVVTSSYNQ
jgi:hypothetical protein